MIFKNIQKYDDKELIKLRKDLEISLTKSQSAWGSSEEKLVKKKSGKSGDNKKEKKQIQRTIQQINTILQQRGLYNIISKNKPRSKRRKRRQRGKLKNKKQKLKEMNKEIKRSKREIKEK